MILPASHHFTKLVVSAEHIKLHHAGPQLLTASLREKYWIPRIRNLVKTVTPATSLRHKQRNSSWASYHQLEFNLQGHFSQLA
jgi:hypothetical protein